MKFSNYLARSPAIRRRVEVFWQQVEENLKQGKVRLVFVAEQTSKELRRLVEFLNEKMADVDVLAVELKQYVSDSHKVLAPRIIGATEEARAIKRNPAARANMNRETFLSRFDPIVSGFFGRVLDCAEERGFFPNWGTMSFSIRANLVKAGRPATFIQCWLDGNFTFYFAELHLPDSESKALRQELLTFSVFRESGAKTLTSPVNAQTVDNLNKVLDFILEQTTQIAATH